ncbi:unnamed protein product [Citrullus colocynthis]|uniref:Uncharacterized protein n=1 Tax=Citrullus colocynthis TaxID=252529 RepID=A0ABP0XM28_9ROSI
MVEYKEQQGAIEIGEQDSHDKMRFKSTADEVDDWLGGTTDGEQLNLLTSGWAARSGSSCERCWRAAGFRAKMAAQWRQVAGGRTKKKKMMRMGEGIPHTSQGFR